MIDGCQECSETLFITLSHFKTLTVAKPQTSNAIDFTEDRVDEENRYKALIQELCKFRPPNEYFRLSAESNCRDVVR